MVLTEAMAASTPVIAVDAPGVREVLCDGQNGFKLPNDNKHEFVGKLEDYYNMPKSGRQKLIDGALITANKFSMSTTANTAIELYTSLIRRGRSGPAHGSDLWSTARRRFDEEWQLWSNVGRAAAHAIVQRD